MFRLNVPETLLVPRLLGGPDWTVQYWVGPVFHILPYLSLFENHKYRTRNCHLHKTIVLLLHNSLLESVRHVRFKTLQNSFGLSAVCKQIIIDLFLLYNHSNIWVILDQFLFMSRHQLHRLNILVVFPKNPCLHSPHFNSKWVDI